MTQSSPIDNVNLDDIPSILHLLSPYEKERLLSELEHLEKLKKNTAAQRSFLSFVREVWPSFIAGRHHSKMADAFEKVVAGTCKRLIICMPPRHTKSEFASYLLPAWYLGKFPDRKIIQCSHTAELAVGFGRKVRNLVDTDVYRAIFPKLVLQADSKAAGRWNTSQQGDYFAIGVGGAVTGKGADCAYFACKCLTKRGYISISEVKVGEEVWGYDHKTGKERWTCVRAVSTQRKPELVDISGFICTPEHRVWTGSAYIEARQTVGNRIAVSSVWGQLPPGEKSSSSNLPEAGERSPDVLFQPVLGAEDKLSCLQMREENGVSRNYLPCLPPFGEAYKTNVQELWHRISSSQFGIPESTFSWASAAQLLWREMLRYLQNRTSSVARAVDWIVQKVWYGHCQKASVLRHGLLCYAQSQEHGIFREVEPAKTPGFSSGWRSVCPLRESQPAYGGAPYKPCSNEPRHGEFSSPLRALSQPLSSSDFGACAADFGDILPGEGHWVVDIQTETKNFFCEGVLAHNCLIIDDPHSEQEAAIAASNPEVYDKVYEWYTSGPRQRLQPGGAIVVVMTRWSQRDLVAQVLKAEAQRGGEGWEVIEFPAILPSGNPLWPEFWPLEELTAIKEELPSSKWLSQYQQNPTAEEGAIVKREWWRVWEKETPPKCQFVLTSWDTAFEKSQRADYSAMTTWGVFYQVDEATGKEQANIILLNAVRERAEFPRLKQLVLQQYKDWKPDGIIIEKKASGGPLIYELRAMGLSVQEFTPTKGNDKISRLNAVSDLFASGRVWMPNTHWAEEVRDEVAEFPNSQNDDYTDSVSMALLRFRKGGYIRTGLDEDDAPKVQRRHREGYY